MASVPSPALHAQIKRIIPTTSAAKQQVQYDRVAMIPTGATCADTHFIDAHQVRVDDEIHAWESMTVLIPYCLGAVVSRPAPNDRVAEAHVCRHGIGSRATHTTGRVTTHSRVPRRREHRLHHTSRRNTT